MTKVGRVLLVTCGEEAIHALDIATGEDVWRFAERGCFQFKPLVSNETVVAAAVRGRREGALFAIDLYSGQPRWQRELKGPPTSEPVRCRQRRARLDGRVKRPLSPRTACKPASHSGKPRTRASASAALD